MSCGGIGMDAQYIAEGVALGQALAQWGGLLLVVVVIVVPAVHGRLKVVVVMLRRGR